MAELMKTCPKCGVEKQLIDFCKNKNAKDGHACWCKSCKSECNKEYYSRPENKARRDEYRKEYYNNNKEKLAKYRKEYRQRSNVKKNAAEYYLLQKYGITMEGRNKIIDDQGGRCAICECELDMAKNTCVDHDHKTGRVRGVLCNNCNKALGFIQDNPEIISRMVNYLEFHANKKSVVVSEHA